MNKRKTGFLAQILMFSMMPLLLAAVVLCVLSSLKLSQSLEDSTYGQLKIAVEGLKWYYAWDIINLGEPNYEHDYVDNLKDQNIEQTLFIGDTRFITSIVDGETGKRFEGTKADETIYKKVSEGEDYYQDGVMIDGREYYVYYTPVMDTSGKVVGMAFAGIPETVVSNEIKSAVVSMVAVTIVITIICIVIVVLCAIKIKKPIAKISGYAKELAGGNLSVDIEAKSGVKEISVLIDSTRELQENLKNIITIVNDKSTELIQNVSNITEGVDVSNKAANDIVKAVDELAKGSLEMAESVQNTAETMYGIGEDISAIAELAGSANGSAAEVRNISAKAKKNLESLMAANNDTIVISQDVINGIKESSEAVNDIKRAADVISEIASQTSLLSLNASIEAARAGEAGRGFAVVASNIQELAEQSDRSAKEIQSVIQNIVQKSEHNVILANQIKDAVDNEGGVLKEVNTSFDEVNNQVEVTADAVNEIQIKSTALDRNKNKVLDEVSTLSSISEENAASCEETTASMEELSANIETINVKAQETGDIADALEESVEYFKL